MGSPRRKLKCFGVEYPMLASLAKEFGISRETIAYRVRKVMSYEEAVTTPLKDTSIRCNGKE